MEADVSTRITFLLKVKSDCTKDMPALILYLMINEETCRLTSKDETLLQCYIIHTLHGLII
jgi:hypothetical protein